MDILCKKEGCKFKPKENEYCGKHKRTAILLKAQQEGKRLCNVYRGCFTELTNAEKKCQSCREKSQESEKQRYLKGKKEFEETIKNSTNLLKCRECRSEYKQFETRKKEISRLCISCYEKQKEREKNRVRTRNYQEEAKRNIKAHWVTFCRVSKRRNKEITLTELEFNDLIVKPCFYCAYSSEKEVLGVDRLDNNKGYTTANCVSCCKICNRMKHIYHPSFFIEKAKLITEFTLSKLVSKSFYEKWKEYIPTKASSYGAFYTHTTKTRDIEVKLSPEEYLKLTREQCYLCGYQSDKGIGLDRIDSSKQEYSLETVKPCCGSCNMIKATNSLDVLYSYMKKISDTHTVVPQFSEIPKQKFLMGGAKSKIIPLLQ